MNSLELAKKRAKIEKSKSKRSKLDEHIKAIEYLLFEEKFTLRDHCKLELYKISHKVPFNGTFKHFLIK